MDRPLAFETRVHGCAECGGPVQGDAQGGAATCGCCQTANRIAARQGEQRGVVASLGANPHDVPIDGELLATAVSTPSVVMVGVFPVLLPIGAGVAVFGALSVLGAAGTLATAAPWMTTLGLMVTILLTYALRARWLTVHGIRTTALVLRAVDTGTRDRDGTPHIKLLLLVELPNEPRYAVWYHQHGMRSSEQPGNRVPVILHPRNRRRLRVP